MDFVLLLGIAFAASMVQGFLGFGFGILAMGLLTEFQGFHHATALVNLIGMFAPCVILWRLRREIEWPLIKTLLPQLLIGIVLGVVAIVTLSPGLIKQVLGVTIVAFAVWSLWRGGAGAEVRRLWALPAGFLSGLLGGAFNMGGPPLIAYIYRQPLSPRQLKSTVQLLFIMTSLTRIPLIGSQGYFTREVLTDTAWCFLPLAVGAVAGVRLGDLLPPEKFRRIAWIGFLVMGAWLAVGEHTLH